jgi:hypothetical protein
VRNVRAHLAAGLAGVLVAGSSGEAALLDEEERRALVAWAREAGGRRTGAGGRGCGEHARHRQARPPGRGRRADAVLVVAPHYYGRRMTDDALADHFAAVADASPRPVLLYNIPVYAHLVLSPELVARAAAHPNVAGMKDSAGDLSVLAATSRRGPAGSACSRARRDVRGGARRGGGRRGARRVAVRAGGGARGVRRAPPRRPGGAGPGAGGARAARARDRGGDGAGRG